MAVLIRMKMNNYLAREASFGRYDLVIGRWNVIGIRVYREGRNVSNFIAVRTLRYRIDRGEAMTLSNSLITVRTTA